MDLQDPGQSDERKKLLESLLAGPAMETWMQMKDENGIDAMQEVNEDEYQEVVRDFLLEIITVETAADTLAWLKDVPKSYNMKVSNFLSQIRHFNHLLKFMPRVRTLDVHGDAVDLPNEHLNKNDITLLVRRSGPESWQNTATKTGNDYKNAKDTARYYNKLKTIDNNEKKRNDKRDPPQQKWKQG